VARTYAVNDFFLLHEISSFTTAVY